MNRSYSKIRHIQESNMKLEKRLLSEQSPESSTQINPQDAATMLLNWDKKDSIGLTKFLTDTKRGNIKSKVEKIKSSYANDMNDDETLKQLGNEIVKDKELLSKVEQYRM